MKFYPCKCKIIKIGHSERRPMNDYNLAGEKLRESVSERDLVVDIVPSLSPEHHVRRIVKRLTVY